MQKMFIHGKYRLKVYAFSLALADFLGRRTAWMLGRTPPWAMVTPASSLFSSSSFLGQRCSRGNRKGLIGC